MTVNNIIELTESAYNYLKNLINENKEAKGVRVNITSGGCQGLTYALEIVTEVKEADLLVQKDDVSLYIAPKAVLFVSRMIMDYVKTPMGANVVFQNPNAKSTCGCGKSFCTSSENGEQKKCCSSIS